MVIICINYNQKFAANCGICKKRQTKVGPKYQYPKPIGLTDADKNADKEAARLRKDETLLLEIHEVDLLHLLEKNEIPFNMILVMLADSASTMRGKVSGLEVKMRENVAPQLLGTDGESCHHVQNIKKNNFDF